MSAARWVTGAVRAARDGDPLLIRTDLDKASTSLGVGGCVDQVILPTLRMIGELWATGQCGTGEERIATEAIRSWLDWRVAYAPRPRTVGQVLLACGPRDLHTVGLESLALLLRLQGLPCRNLGARTSTRSLIIAALATQPAAIVIVCHMTGGRRHAVKSIAEATLLGGPVFYAGSAFVSSVGREDVPGAYLGVNLEAASQQIAASLTSAGAERSRPPVQPLPHVPVIFEPDRCEISSGNAEGY
jgi:hypothetical protein